MKLQIIETMPHTENVEEFLEKLGHFYEMIDDGPVSRVMKQNSQQQTPVKASLVTNGLSSHSASVSDSSSETSDTIQSHLPADGLSFRLLLL